MSKEITPAERIAGIDWARVREDLDGRGAALVKGLLGARECEELRALYEREGVFRKTVVMHNHGYGRGEYRYFRYPLPAIVSALREAAYAPLAAIANAWNAALEDAVRFPEDHAAWLDRCHAAGQQRPTPLILRYGPGDYNCLHQDLYGEHVFPLQLTVLLSKAGREFSGGEFVLSEQRPRMQSRPHVVPLDQGDVVIFPVRHRPVRGARTMHRVNMRHGVSEVLSGQRYTLGIIFHDAS